MIQSRKLCKSLLQEDPLLMGRIARVWSSSPNLPCPGEAKGKRDLINRMRLLIASLDPPAGTSGS